MFGFVIARFAVFLRPRRYVRGIDEGRFRAAFGSRVAYGVTGLLVVAGVGMALFLATL